MVRWTATVGLLLALIACSPDRVEVVLQTPDQPAMITVLEFSNEPLVSDSSQPDTWPTCYGYTQACVTRIISPCDEVEAAYTFSHQAQEHLEPFTAEQGSIVDEYGRALAPSEIVALAESYDQQIERGPALQGDKYHLIGTFTERGEIDVIHSGHTSLDYVNCKDRESVVQHQ